MAITYRITDTPLIPSTPTVKGSALTSEEIDANFKYVDNELGTKASLASPTFTGTVSGITGSMVVNTPSGGISSTTVQDAISELAARELLTGQTGLANDPASIPAPTAGQSLWGTNLLGEILHYIVGTGWVVVGNPWGSITPCIGGIIVPTYTFSNVAQITVHRAGAVNVSATIPFSINAGWTAIHCDIFKNGIPYTTTINHRSSSGDAGTYNVHTSVQAIPVIAGDIISMGLQFADGTTATTDASSVRPLSVQYV